MLHIAYVGEDIDAAKGLAAWAVEEARDRGLHEERGVSGAVEPVVEIFVYAGMGQESLAQVIALACEGVWSKMAFAGMAHVAPERHNALLGADVVVDAMGLASSDGTLCSIAEEHQTLQLDLAFLAPDARLITLTAGQEDNAAFDMKRAS